MSENDDDEIIINLEVFRKPDETEKEWQLKRQFIEKYRDQFSEARLICLAQCYSNIESYGCTYSTAVMEQVKSLTKGLENEPGTKACTVKNKTENKQPSKRKRMLRRITYKKFKKTHTEESFKLVFDEFIETIDPFESFEFVLENFKEYLTNKNN